MIGFRKCTGGPDAADSLSRSDSGVKITSQHRGFWRSASRVFGNQGRGLMQSTDISIFRRFYIGAGFLLGALGPAVATAAVTAVAQDAVYLRESAERNSKVLAYLQPGNEVGVLARMGELAKVRYLHNYEGFAPSRFLVSLPESECRAGYAIESACALATVNVNVRAGKGSEHEKVGFLPAGEVVQVVTSESGFLRLNVRQERVGFVEAKALAQASANKAPAITQQTSLPEEEQVAENQMEAPVDTPPQPRPVVAPASRARPEPVTAPARSAEAKQASPSSAPAEAQGVPAAPTRSTPRTRGTTTRSLARMPSGRLDRWVVGGSMGFSHATTTASGLQEHLNSAGLDANILGFDEEDYAYQVYAKRKLNSWVSVRLAFMDLGEFVPEMEVSSSELEQVRNVASRHFPAGDYGGYLGADLNWSMGVWRFELGAGAFIPLDDEVRFRTETEEVTVKGSGLAPMFRVEFGRLVLNNTTIGFDISATDRNGWLVTPMLIKLQHSW